MEEEQLKRMESMSDHELLAFVTEKESSQRRWAAQHILDTRRNQSLRWVAIWAAIASTASAIAAFISAWGAFH